MTTELIYFVQPDVLTFDATVVEVGPAQTVPGLPADARPVVLDRTAFYPGGGGQPCDIGRIGDLPVLAADHLPSQPDVVVHWVPAAADDRGTTARLPKPGDLINCEVDRPRRLDLMQQHTGQHIISAIAMRDFGAATVGFHLSEETATVDLDLATAAAGLDKSGGLEQFVEVLEDRACQIVFADRPVRIHLVDPGQAPQQAAQNGLELRVRQRGPAPKGGDKWRVIEVDGLDLSPCGGTHVTSTGQVGLITIQRWESVRDGVRLEFACGLRALAAHRWRRDALRKQALALSVHEREAVDQALRAVGEAQAADKETRALRAQLLVHRAHALAAAAERLPGGSLIRLHDDELTADDLKYLANALCTEPGRIALLASAAGGVPRLVFARSDDLTVVNAGRMLTQALGQLGGRGGGPPKLGQGGGGDPAGLTAAMAWAADESRRLLGG